jgi:hypothetical protein
MVQTLDTSVLDSDDEWRGTGSMFSVVDRVQKTFIVVGYGDTDDERAQDIERKQSVNKPIGGLGDVSARSFCFSSSCNHEFG